jgi:hypothetical protein
MAKHRKLHIDPKIEAILQKAFALDNGRTKLALLEEAIRMADAQNNVDLGFQIRQELIDTATFAGYQEKALVAFSWCLAQCDRSPDDYSEEEMLWKYKWVAGSLWYFPSISRAQIDATLEDMTRRYQRAGRSLRPVSKLQCRFAMHRGDAEAARAFQKQWRDAEADESTDCAACERNDQVEFFFFLGKDERGVEWAEPIVRGKLKCGEIPHLTLSKLLLPLVRLGRIEEAVQRHLRGYRLTYRNKEFLHEVAEHLAFLVLTDNLARAVKVFTRHLPWALETMVLTRRFQFDLAAVFLMDRLLETGQTTIAVRLPKEFPLARNGGTCAVAALRDHFAADLRDLAGQFDARNGTDYFARRCAEPQEWRKLLTPYKIESGLL